MRVNPIQVLGAFIVSLCVSGSSSTVFAYETEPYERKPTSCKAVGPRFAKPSPARDSTTDSFSKLAFSIENQADINTLIVKVNGTPIDVETTEHGKGAMRIVGHLDEPITEQGVVLVSVVIQSKAGACTARLAYRVNVTGAGGSEAESPEGSEKVETTK